jgi:hypothetical protein
VRRVGSVGDTPADRRDAAGSRHLTSGGKDVLTRLRDYVIAHINEPIEVSTLEDGGAQPVPFYPVAHPIRWRQSAPLRRAFAMATEPKEQESSRSAAPFFLNRGPGARNYRVRAARPGRTT